MSSTYLSPSLNFNKQVCSNNNGSVLADLGSENLVYRFCFLALCCLARFSNTCFALSFALRVASAPIPVSLRLENGVVRLEKKKQVPKNIGAYSAIFTVVIATGNIHATSPGTAS